MSTKYWANLDKGNVDQDNNSIESIVGKILNKGISRETCGPSSLEACLESLGVDQSQCGDLQPSDYYTCAMNDQKLIRQAYFPQPSNRYLEVYPKILTVLYPEIKCSVKPLDKEGLRKSLTDPDTACIINLIKPGHFVAAFHIDGDGTIYYNDSWKEDYFNPSPDHRRKIHIDALFANMKNGYVEISL